MTGLMETYEQRQALRRSSDEWKFWLPLLLSLCGQVLMLGVIYGKLGGRLDLIEYRLHQIEMKVGIAP